MSSLFDHFRVSPNEDHGEPLFFNHSMFNDIPFRGPVPPAIKQDEVDELVTTAEGKVKLFDLSQPEDAKEYEMLYHRHANGWYRITHREHHYDPQTHVMRVYVEWLQLYKEAPPGLADVVHGEVPRVA